MKNAETVWKKVLDEFSRDMSPIIVTTWFEDAEPLSFFDGKLTIFTPTEIKKDVIDRQYRPVILAALRRVTGLDDVAFTVVCSEQEKNMVISKADSESRAEDTYTFENFVVGNSNRFAHAAAIAVTNRPSAAYNPLFIYGPSGLGKTHLLHAISNSVAKNDPSLSVVYIKCEEFTNELIRAIETGSVEFFRQKYRRANFFLVDDIQFISGKERTQEEFFHTFNALHDIGNQIVLTSDRPPKEMYSLEERLRTRFEGGLIADIQPPDYETRCAIISKKAGSYSVKLPPEIVDYLALAIKSNVRQLEGAVKKLFAMRELMNQEIDMRLAEQTVSEVIGQMPGMSPTPGIILNEVSSMYGISVSKIKSSSRAKEIVVPRQVALYLIRNLTNMSLPEIGRDFDLHYSTVLHAINKIDEQMKEDPELKKRVRDLIKNIESK